MSSQGPWSWRQCYWTMPPRTRGGPLINHLAGAIFFGSEFVCIGIDADYQRLQFLVDAANEKQVSGNYHLPPPDDWLHNDPRHRHDHPSQG